MANNPNVKALRGIVAAWDAAIEAHNRAFRDQMAREKAAGCDEAAWDACLEAHGNGPELAAIEAEAGKSADVANLPGAVLVSWARRVLARS